MLTRNIDYKNFKIKKNSQKVKRELKKLLEEIPFSSFNLGWLLPSMATFMIVNVSLKVKEKYF